MNLGISLGLNSFVVNGGGGSSPSPSPSPSISDLFSNGELGGAWRYDNAFTDTGMTASAGDGDYIAALGDYSGNGNHLIQATASARPQLNGTQLDFDDTDDFFGSVISGLSYDDGVTLVVAATIASGNDWIASVSNNTAGIRGEGEYKNGPTSAATGGGIHTFLVIRTTGASGVDVKARTDAGAWVYGENQSSSSPLGISVASNSISGKAGSVSDLSVAGFLVIGRNLTNEEATFAEQWVKGLV